jgi:hypothetical protein
MLSRYLRARDVPCPLCGHSLRDLPGTACPGCGRELALVIGVTDPYLRAWIALAASLLIPAGMGVLCLVIIAREGMPPRGYVALRASIWFFLAAIPLAWAAVGWRRAFLRLPRGAQMCWAIAAGAVTALAFVLFLYGMGR